MVFVLAACLVDLWVASKVAQLAASWAASRAGPWVVDSAGSLAVSWVGLWDSYLAGLKAAR